ncbi:MAG: SPOR domain-containing protein [Treponema sp.]|jgi:hypothetical protein|nr:SPOR domain-containing protein [Treponema sp.]
MKINYKTKIVIYTLASLLLLIAASPWEGAAAMAPEGELPVTGFFVSTNSFPKNTVVDITNIETNRSTRVIVANTLDSPGLLAVVSREAAEIIGMRPGSVSRIRMVQPTDPIAYTRFTESMTTGIPEFDSGNVITEENYRDEVYRDDTYRPPAEIVESRAAAPEQPVISSVTGPSYTLEPEWRSREIVDLPGYTAQTVEHEPVRENPWDAPVEISHDTSHDDTSHDDASDINPWEIADEPEETNEDTTYVAEMLFDEEEADDPWDTYWDEPWVEIVDSQDEVIYDDPFYITEQPQEEVHEDIPDYMDDWFYEEIVEETPEPEDHWEFALVPADEQPPEDTIYGIDPADIIPEIPELVELPLIEVPLIEAPLDDEPPAITVYPSEGFPVISSLDRGWYYVQIAAAPNPASVETALSQIDSRYNPVVLKDGDSLYRILLGPLNQGESAAILARFRSIGYKDAFVRRGG